MYHMLPQLLLTKHLTAHIWHRGSYLLGSASVLLCRSVVQTVSKAGEIMALVCGYKSLVSFISFHSGQSFLSDICEKLGETSTIMLWLRSLVFLWDDHIWRSIKA